MRGPARGAWLLLPWLKNRNTIQARVATRALNRFMFCVKVWVFAPVVKLVSTPGADLGFCAAGRCGRCPEVGGHGAVHGWSDTLSLGIRVQGLGLGASGLESRDARAQGLFRVRSFPDVKSGPMLFLSSSNVSLNSAAVSLVLAECLEH